MTWWLCDIVIHIGRSRHVCCRYYVAAQPALFGRLRHVSLSLLNERKSLSCLAELSNSAPCLCSMTLSRDSRPSAGMVAMFPSSLTRLELSSSCNLQLSTLTTLQHLILDGHRAGYPGSWGYKPCLMPVSLARLEGSLDLSRDPDSALQLTRLTNLQHLVLHRWGGLTHTVRHISCHACLRCSPLMVTTLRCPRPPCGCLKLMLGA